MDGVLYIAHPVVGDCEPVAADRLVYRPNRRQVVQGSTCCMFELKHRYIENQSCNVLLFTAGAWRTRLVK